MLTNRSAALARLAEVVAALTGCLGRDDRKGGEVIAGGATILAESVWFEEAVGIGGGAYRLRDGGALFSFPFAVLGRVGDLDSLRLWLDIDDADRVYGELRNEEDESLPWRLLIGIRDVVAAGRDLEVRDMESGGVGYSVGMVRAPRSGILGTACGRKASISLRLR